MEKDHLANPGPMVVPVTLTPALSAAQDTDKEERRRRRGGMAAFLSFGHFDRECQDPGGLRRVYAY